MNEDKNFEKRNALNAEKAQLMSNLAANTSMVISPPSITRPT